MDLRKRYSPVCPDDVSSKKGKAKGERRRGGKKNNKIITEGRGGGGGSGSNWEINSKRKT